MGLYPTYLLHNLFDALVCCFLVAEENITVGVGNLIALIHQLLKLADMLVLTASQSQKFEAAPFVDLAEGKWRASGQ